MNRLIVMSADALVHEDIETLRTLPCFSSLMAHASGAKTLRSIYPTITYPAHASIASGRYPDKHGVVDNSELHIGMTGEMPWNWFHKAFQGDDLFAAAKRAGLKTAGVFWPVTGNHPDIDYLVAEYWPQGEGDSYEDALRRAGTSELVMNEVVRPHLTGWTPRCHPEADQFVVDCACDIIRKYQPHLLMLHPANVDTYRHMTGLFTPRVTQGIRETDGWLGDLVQATKDAGVYDETTFVLMSDHGQLDIKRVLNPNVILRDHGLIETDPDGKMIRWDAFIKSTALSAQVYLRRPDDPGLHARVENILRHMTDEGIYGISRMFTREEAEREEHLSGGFSFVLESDGFTSFGDACIRPIVRSFDMNDYRAGRATHGHLPDKGPQPVFYTAGPAVRKDVLIERRPIVDVAPTLAKIIGVSLQNADGTAMNEILW